MHKLLERQLRRHLGPGHGIPKELEPLLAAIDEAYEQADIDRRLVERSLELTSQELMENNRQLSNKTRALEAIIAEQKQMETRLRIADRMASVGTLAAGVAHEINNPLAFVTANLDYLAEHVESHAGNGASHLGSEFSEALREAIEGAQRIQAIVSDLKSFSRVGDERRGPVDLRKVFDAALSMTWNEVRHRARLVKEYAEVPPVDASEARLGQVFVNLIVNAAQAIPEGHASNNEIRAVVRGDGDRVIAELSDTGCGIASEMLGRVFDPFFTTKAVGVGTGLGLSICHGIVTGFGGEISVESEVGRGSLFRVTLPVSHGRIIVERPSTPAPASRRRGRVMIVDDDAPVGRAVRRTLSPEHEVVVETSARSALVRLAAGERFDVILCDLMMPELTGMDVHAELSGWAPGCAERLVFLTGGAFTQHAVSFRERVSNHFVEKPFDAHELRALIRTLVDGGPASLAPADLTARSPMR